MFTDRFGQELRRGQLIITACGGYGGKGTLEIGVIKNVESETHTYNNWRGELTTVTRGKIFIDKITYINAYADRPPTIYIKNSVMTNNFGIVVVQGPDSFAATFPDIVREKIFELLAAHTR